MSFVAIPGKYDFVGSFLRPQALKDAKALYQSGKLSEEEYNKVVDEEIGIDEKWAKGLKYSLKIIDTVPTVSERPQGEWVGNAFDEHHCNRCGHPALWEEEPDGYYEVQSRFCPNCGAKME